MAASIYLIIAVLVVVVEVLRKREVVFDFLFFFNFFFINSFAITPFLLIYLGSDAGISVDYFSGLEFVGRVVTPLLVLEGYLFFLVGFYHSKSQKTLRRLTLDPSISDRTIFIMLLLSFVIFYSTLYIYTAQFGGYLQTIIKTELIRNGELEGGAFEFVKHFMKVSVIALLFTFYKAFHYRKNIHTSTYRLFFYVCLINFLVHFFLLNSRGFLIVTLLSMYVLTSLVNNKIYFRRMAVGGAGVFLVILYGNVFFSSVATLVQEGWDPFVREFSMQQRHEAGNLTASIMKNFVHPILSLELSIENRVDYRYFIDFPIAIATLVPERISGIHLPPSISVINTYLHHGVCKSTIPPGIIGLFYYSAGVIGVFIGMFTYGFVGGAIQQVMMNSMRYKKNGMIVFYFLLAYAYGAFVDSGEPSSYMISNFMLTVIISVVILFYSKIRIVNR